MIQQFVPQQYGLHKSYSVMMQPGTLQQVPSFPIQPPQQQQSYSMQQSHPQSSQMRNFGYDPSLDEKLRYIHTPCRDRVHKKRHAETLMQYVGDWKSDRGTPCAAYRCPVCGYMEFYVCDFKTKQARLHWFESAK